VYLALNLAPSLPTLTVDAGYGFHRRLSVCLSVYPHDISKTDTARVTKLDTQIFHDEFWKTINFGVKRSKVKVTNPKNTAGVGLLVIILQLPKTLVEQTACKHRRNEDI